MQLGELEFDFNTAGVKGLGQKWTDETFEIFGDKIKSVKATWKYGNNYPNGESLGHKQFWEEMNLSYDKEKALKSTTFYKTMSEKGFSKIKLILDDLDETVIILIN
ncbi:hypothetical protein B4N84_08990 [Flavobacterium sp. IR1]|nr:hypothetical protein B4N84_08990 [Flavobacterium sp. IR1]